MKEQLKFYIDGKWVKPLGTKTIDVINPATEEVVGRVSLGTKEDVDRAVSAARKAFPSYSQTTKEERIALIEKIMACYQERIGELAEVFDKAGVPAGVFNLVNGDGPTVGVAIASHPEVDMVSFTGSTRAGIQVAKNAADSVKRVTQELGGKSANIVLEDADLEAAVTGGGRPLFMNTGHSCKRA